MFIHLYNKAPIDGWIGQATIQKLNIRQILPHYFGADLDLIIAFLDYVEFKSTTQHLQLLSPPYGSA